MDAAVIVGSVAVLTAALLLCAKKKKAPVVNGFMHTTSADFGEVLTQDWNPSFRLVA